MVASSTCENGCGPRWCFPLNIRFPPSGDGLIPTQSRLYSLGRSVHALHMIRTLLAAAVLSLSACSAAGEEVREVPSPNGRVVAVVSRSHIATVSDHYRIFLRPRDGGRSIEVADFFGLSDPSGVELPPDVARTGTSNLEVRVAFAREGNVSRASAVVGGINVRIVCVGSISRPDPDNRCDARRR